ncbi:hypothetical protein SAMN02799633_00766 [Bacillus sp. UNCCL81]|nr:hypothetical protein SAMN02799633_00766 [Bacillus sp. UNCCL81]
MKTKIIAYTPFFLLKKIIFNRISYSLIILFFAIGSFSIVKFSNLNPMDIYKSMYRFNICLLLLIPGFLLLNNSVSFYFNNSRFLTRYTKLFEWWRDRSLITGILAFFYSLITTAIFSIPVLLNSEQKVVTFIFLSFIIQFFGYVFLGIVYNIINYYLNMYFTLLLILFCLISLKIVESLNNNFNPIYKIMYLTYKNNFILNVNDYLNTGSLSVSILISFYVGFLVIKDKDIKWR